MDYAGKEVIKPRGHLVSLTTAEVGNWVTESFRICFLGEVKMFFSDDRCPQGENNAG